MDDAPLPDPDAVSRFALIREIKSSGRWITDQRKPMLAMLYGSSVASCMSSALSEPDGAGLGTLGLPPAEVTALCRAAGFARVTVHDLDDPANLYYEVRSESAPREAS